MSSVDCVWYAGVRYRVQASGRYYQSGRKTDPERLLHRRVWSDANGPIPENMHVHHRDGDWRNNDLSNLDMVAAAKHLSEHTTARLRSGDLQPPSRKALALAAVWHASDEGLAWHREQGRTSWANRQPERATCVVCHSEYETYFRRRSKYCSVACASAIRYRRHFTDVRSCAWCSKDFVANRHRATACCSRLCSNRKRGSDSRVQPDAG